MSATAETIVIARAPTGVPSRSTRRHPRRSPSRTAARRPVPKSQPQPQPQPQSQPRRARRGAFVAFVLGILTVGLLGMLLVNTALATGAFTLTELQSKNAQLIETEQALSEQLARAESPVFLEEAARALGMVPQSVPVFLRLEDGAILGNPIPQPVPIAPEVTDPVVGTDLAEVTDPVGEVVAPVDGVE